jgi:sec-independent protein translocase protein TatB
MFDIGFSEIFVIAVVALLVLGPERLPKAARFAGLWVRRARAQWHSVKSELETELAAEELKRSLRETEDSMREARDEISAGLDEARNRFKQEQEELQRELDRLDSRTPEPEEPGEAVADATEPPAAGAAADAPATEAPAELPAEPAPTPAEHGAQRR